MKATAAGAYLTKLTRFGLINSYLVREDDGLTLVDTGIAGSEKLFQDAAQRLGLPIVRIALTHAHGDHVGSLDALHGLLPNAEVLISARDARFLRGDRSPDRDEPQDKLRGGYVTCSTRPTRQLMPGDRVGSLEVVASPGHTPGHIAFFDTRDRSLIAGDAFMTQGGVAVSGTLALLFPISPFVTWHRPTALESARALRALSPSRLAVGHGPLIEQPLAAMDHAIGVASKALGQVQLAD